MVIGRLADAVTRGVEDAASSVTEVFEPTLRLGVTGLSRAGKTVFITSLVANLIDRGRMPGFTPGARIETAFLQPQPDDTVPRFDYEGHLAQLTARAPRWPEGTRAIAELRLSLKVRPAGLLSGFRGPRTVHLDILDYPGEWLLDLGLMEKDYDEWSARATEHAGGGRGAGATSRARSRSARFPRRVALRDRARDVARLEQHEPCP